MNDDLTALLPYCAPAQERTLRAVIEAGSYRKAAKAMGVTRAPCHWHPSEVRIEATEMTILAMADVSAILRKVADELVRRHMDRAPWVAASVDPTITDRRLRTLISEGARALWEPA